MAKKPLSERLVLIDKTSREFNEKANKPIVGRLSANSELLEKLNHKFIETPSLNFNAAIGGGWPIGNITVLTGDSDSGKTFILLESIAKKQKEDPNFVALWLESESSLKDSLLKQLDIDMERFVYLEHERDGAGERAIDRLEAYIAAGVADMVVVNSLKCLVPSEEFKKGMGDLQVGAAARLNAKMMRKLTAVVSEHEVAMVIVQHLTTQIGGMIFGDPLILSGGQAIKYGAILIVDLRKRSIQDSDPISRDEGIKIGVTVKKNHLVFDRNPYQKTEYFGIYGQGTEIYLEAMELAISQGILAKAGSYIRVLDENGEPKMINGEKMQWQGAAKFRQYCIDNPSFFNGIKAQLNGETVNMSEEEIEQIKAEEDSMDKLAEEFSNEKKKKKK